MKTITLSQTYVAGPSAFGTLTFREPQLSDYRRIGRVLERQGDVVVTFSEAVWSYADQLLQDLNPGALAKLTLADALLVEGTVIGFFTEAMLQRVSPESSSSGSDGALATSST